MAILEGYGKLGIYSTDLSASAIAQDLLLASDNLLDFSIATNTAEARKARAWRNCKRVVVGSVSGDEERSLAIQIASVDWAALQLAEGELASNVNVTLPIWKSGTVPSTAPYEIIDADIAAGNQATVKSYLVDKVGTNMAGYLTRVAIAPTSAREVQVDGANTKLVFHSGLAGGGVAYVVDVAQTNLPSIGKAASPVKLNNLSFIGHGCGDGFDEGGLLLHIPKISRSGRPTYNTADDVTTLEIPFEILVAGGEREGVHFYNMPS